MRRVPITERIALACLGATAAELFSIEIILDLHGNRRDFRLVEPGDGASVSAALFVMEPFHPAFGSAPVTEAKSRGRRRKFFARSRFSRQVAILSGLSLLGAHTIGSGTRPARRRWIILTA